jgi:hypothetical protein
MVAPALPQRKRSHQSKRRERTTLESIPSERNDVCDYDHRLTLGVVESLSGVIVEITDPDIMSMTPSLAPPLPAHELQLGARAARIRHGSR